MDILQALSGGSMAQARMSLSILAGLLHLLLVQIQINHLSSYSRSTRHVEAAVLDYVLAFLQLSLSLTLLETTSLLLLERFCPWISWIGCQTSCSRHKPSHTLQYWHHSEQAATSRIASVPWILSIGCQTSSPSWLGQGWIRSFSRV